ncbi:DUF3820 family protein [Sulfurimonas sp.]|uniref:putative quorum-sensing-regulated virulence factor n=1 Tax=Sulfurimonas sp. TaxID=2022749 RepID=UPI00261C5191|nr:DUF3820 family protein [Sulfurimonas sp.]
MKKIELIFTEHLNSFSVFVKNLEQLSVVQIQELQKFVLVRHGYFDFNSFSFSIQKRITMTEFKKLIFSLNIDAIVTQKEVLQTTSSKQVNFGKYKGMLYSEVPDSYLLWLKKNYNGEDRAIIVSELKKRKL